MQRDITVDPATREPIRPEEGPSESGPLILTSRERLVTYAREAGIEPYTVIECPGTAPDQDARETALGGRSTPGIGLF